MTPQNQEDYCVSTNILVKVYEICMNCRISDWADKGASGVY